MTPDEVNSLVAPSPEAETAVTNWLQQSGVTQIHSGNGYVNFATTASAANQLLNTTFSYYGQEGTTKLRTTQYSLPDEVSPHVDIVYPTTFFGSMRADTPFLPPKPSRTIKRKVTRRQVDASCQTSITPNCIKELYNVQNYTADPKYGSNVAFGSFLNESAQYADLALYEQSYGLPSRNFSVQLINGGLNTQDPSDPNTGEANLDVQNIVGVTTGSVPILEYITGGLAPVIPNLDEPTPANFSNEPYVEYYQYLLSQDPKDLPQVISNSYGDDEQSVPIKYAHRVCNMIGMLVSRGITVLESSGDTGVGGPCQSNDGKQTPQFTPQFPSTCAFITAVGGTQSVTPEIAWNASSGGFSNYFPTADYQQQAVQTYLNDYLPATVKAYYTPYTNFSGRGFPDVSAHSLYPRYRVFNNGRASGSGGTSAASPTWGGIVSLLNDARFRAGLPQLGFLNPWLYSDGYKSLNDITAGTALGCTGVDLQNGFVYTDSGIIPYASWNATIGWDPATGLGTPDFQKLKDAVIKLGKGEGKCW